MVIVPEVDSIDHAYLPTQGLSTEDLAHRKELLMMRRMLNGGDFMKGKKEKR